MFSVFTRASRIAARSAARGVDVWAMVTKGETPGVIFDLLAGEIDMG